MEIHNIVEDIVEDIAKEIFIDEKNLKKANFCTCTQCFNDVICYVLNRIEPVYIYSSRGAAHFKMNYLDNLQRRADIVALVHKGIERIILAKRPHFPHDSAQIKSEKTEGCFFNFPTIMGKLLHSVTFSPLSDLAVSLYSFDEPAKMINPNWQNPCDVSQVTPGIFAFFPYPEKASKPGEKREFEFELVVDTDTYETLRHYFKIAVVSENVFSDYYNYNNLFDLKILYCVPRE
ncbi:MAG: late competence development ComFB family protein [Spirochaetales bacterium]|nr:late competence development ComFB family protein [Spirochaetales bacterium]